MSIDFLVLDPRNPPILDPTRDLFFKEITKSEVADFPLDIRGQGDDETNVILRALGCVRVCPIEGSSRFCFSYGEVENGKIVTNIHSYDDVLKGAIQTMQGIYIDASRIKDFTST